MPWHNVIHKLNASNLHVFLSTFTLSLIWLWNFKIGDYAFWNPSGTSTSYAMIFTIIWCFSASGILSLFAYFSKKDKLSFMRILPFCSLTLGLIIGFASYTPTLAPSGLASIAVLIGINYGALFFQWAFIFKVRQNYSGFALGGLSLLLLAVIYIFLRMTHIWEYRVFSVALPLGIFIATTALNHQNLDISNPTLFIKPQRSEQLPHKVLPFLTILAGFVGSVIVQSSMSVGTTFNTLEFALGAAITGLLIFPVSKKLKGCTTTSYLMLFGIVSAVISISILLSLILQIGAISFGMTTVAMVGFWLLFAYVMSLLDSNELGNSFNSNPLFSFTLGLAIFYISIAITKLLCLFFSIYWQANLTLSAIILACSASIAFYLGSRNGLITSDNVSNNDVFKLTCQNIANQNNLTKRELEVMMLLAKGNSLNHIAEELYLSPNTVKTYRSSMYRKLNIHTKQELINLISERST